MRFLAIVACLLLVYMIPANTAPTNSTAPKNTTAVQPNTTGHQTNTTGHHTKPKPRNSNTTTANGSKPKPQPEPVVVAEDPIASIANALQNIADLMRCSHQFGDPCNQGCRDEHQPWCQPMPPPAPYPLPMNPMPLPPHNMPAQPGYIPNTIDPNMPGNPLNMPKPIAPIDNNIPEPMPINPNMPGRPVAISGQNRPMSENMLGRPVQMPGMVPLAHAVDVDACQSAPCMNGATCVDGSFSDYMCMCPPNYAGTNCEMDLTQSTRK